MSHDYHETGLTSQEIAQIGTVSADDDALTVRTKKADADLYAAGIDRSGHPFDWVLLVWFGVIAFSLGMLYMPNFFVYKWPADDVSIWEGYRLDVHSQSTFERDRADFMATKGDSLSTLFQSAAPFEKIFEGCRKECYVPDLTAFRKFMKYAKAGSQAQYENEVCRTLFDAHESSPWSSPEAQYKFDLKSNNCVVANVKEVNTAIRVRNQSNFVVYWQWVVWAAGLIVLFKLRQKAKARMKR